jgi:hypothetical protein
VSVIKTAGNATELQLAELGDTGIFAGIWYAFGTLGPVGRGQDNGGVWPQARPSCVPFSGAGFEPPTFGL